jgi:uncharacterized membrane protein
MILDISPVWPWKLLSPFLDRIDAVAQTVLVLAALLVLLLPLLLWKPPGGVSRGRVLGVWTLLLAALLGALAARTADAASLGLAALVLVPLALVALTVWAYIGTNTTARRVVAVLALRLAAFALAALAVLRPALAFGDKNQERRLVLILVDRSRSMGDVKDHGKDQSRYGALLQHLDEAAPEIKRLADEEKIDVVFRAFGADVVELDPAEPPPPTDPRTDIGTALHKLYEEFAARRPFALFLLSDGADNGIVYNAEDEARRYRALGCLVFTFGYGNPNTPNNVKAIAVVSAVAEPSPVKLKGELTVRTVIDAPGFDGKKVRVKLLLDGKEAASQDVELGNRVAMTDRSFAALRDKGVPEAVLAKLAPLKDVWFDTRDQFRAVLGQRLTNEEAARHQEVIVEQLEKGNEVLLKCMAPAKAGEVEVTVKVEDPKRPGDYPPDQKSVARNQLTTFLSVAKEGLSVLLVDKQRQEPLAICDALEDRRITLHKVWLRGDRPIDANVGDLFQFDRQQYDAIILGDVTPAQMQAVNPHALDEIEKLVRDKGAGLIMIGGYNSFSPVWKNTPIARLLPVELDAHGERQFEREVRMTPTEEGLKGFGFILKRGERKEDAADAWERMTRLEGHSILGTPKNLATVLATTQDGKTPLLVRMDYGGGENAGRVLAFAGDTTNRWIGFKPETAEMHARFWKQIVLWLAKQEEPEGLVWARPDMRRLPVRGEMGFGVGLRKGDLDIPDAEFDVKLRGPDGKAVTLSTSVGRDGRRGVIDRDKTKRPGLYVLEATGSGKDAEGNKVEGKKEVKFIVYDDDPESSQQAADHPFLKKLAKAGNGEFHEGKDLAGFLRDLRKQAQKESKARERHWPDWRTTSTSPFLVLFYLAFVAVLTGEWLLRRRWGMV